LLLILLEPLIAPAHSAGQPTHRRARGGAGARVARNRPAYRAECGAASRTSDDMTLRRQRLVRFGRRVRGGSLRSARIESGLLDRPRMTFVAAAVLLRPALPLSRVGVDVLRARRSSQQQDGKRDDCERDCDAASMALPKALGFQLLSAWKPSRAGAEVAFDSGLRVVRC
jgi:hypothetical protein